MFIKVKKVSAFSASSESYQILDGDTLLAQSSPFSDNEVNESEYCVDTTVDSIYTLRLMDSLSDSWSRGSYIEVKGVSDNVVFKGFMVNHNQESHRISLAQPISQGAVWKFRSGTTTSSTWYLPSFDDATWSSYIDGTSSRSTQGTQFFRKEFTGRTEPVVYEVRFSIATESLRTSTELKSFVIISPKRPFLLPLSQMETMSRRTTTESFSPTH